MFETLHPDKENQRNSGSGKFEGKRVVDARRAPGEPREERNNQRNTEVPQCQQPLATLWFPILPFLLFLSYLFPFSFFPLLMSFL